MTRLDPEHVQKAWSLSQQVLAWEEPPSFAEADTAARELCRLGRVIRDAVDEAVSHLSTDSAFAACAHVTVGEADRRLGVSSPSSSGAAVYQAQNTARLVQALLRAHTRAHDLRAAELTPDLNNESTKGL